MSVNCFLNFPTKYKQVCSPIYCNYFSDSQVTLCVERQTLAPQTLWNDKTNERHHTLLPTKAPLYHIQLGGYHPSTPDMRPRVYNLEWALEAVHITPSCDLLLVDFVAGWLVCKHWPISDKVYKKQVAARHYVDGQHRGCVMEIAYESYFCICRIVVIGCLHDEISMPQFYAAPCDFSLIPVIPTSTYLYKDEQNF